MSENKKFGVDFDRADTLVQDYQVMSRERNPLPNDAQLKDIEDELCERPEDAELYKELGLRLSDLGYYREAAESFSRAITIDPFNWEYFRYRAHRFLSCGLFADSAADFTLASRLKPDNWDIWYLLGLSYFLLRMYDRADWAYTRCETLNRTPDDLVAVTFWHYLSLMRLDRKEEAQKLLEDITIDLPIQEDAIRNSYFQSLLLYKGLRNPEDLFMHVDPKAGAELDVVTQGFGLANYYLFRGERKIYEKLLDQIIETSANSFWHSAFACLASHVDKLALTK